MSVSILGNFDDIRRCMQVLKDNAAEEEFLNALRMQEQFRQKYGEVEKETQRIQKELEASLESRTHLQAKLQHARRLLEMESKLRRKAEKERDLIVNKMTAVADLLQKETNICLETRDQLAFLHTLPWKRVSVNKQVEEKYGKDHTGSFLSALSITQSDDDSFEIRPSLVWQKHQPSPAKNSVPCIGTKLSGASDSASQCIPTASSGYSTDCGGTKQQHQQFTNLPSETLSEKAPPLQSEVAQTKECNDECSPQHSIRKEYAMQRITPIAATKCSTAAKNSLSPQLLRKHNLTQRTFIRADTCTQCQKKIRFGTVGLHCRECPVRCHADCHNLLPSNCVPQAATPTFKGLLGYITDYAPSVPPMIPALIVHCVYEIEARGLTEVGIYRVSGSEREVKSLSERFLRSKTPPNLTNIDVHVLCGCIKDFLSSLREPLITSNLWRTFCKATQQPTEAEIQKDLLTAIDALPRANRDTLAFLILHFQRVAQCPDVLMSFEKIARVFGAAFVGHSSPDLDRHVRCAEVCMQVNTIQNLLRIAPDYWAQFVVLDREKENDPANDENNKTVTRAPSNKKDSLYDTPLKGIIKRRKYLVSSAFSQKK